MVYRLKPPWPRRESWRVGRRAHSVRRQPSAERPSSSARARRRPVPTEEACPRRMPRVHPVRGPRNARLPGRVDIMLHRQTAVHLHTVYG
eukprot:3317714-Prymnesium_polylepis.1